MPQCVVWICPQDVYRPNVKVGLNSPTFMFNQLSFICSIDRKNNPEPWETVDPNKPQKVFLKLKKLFTFSTSLSIFASKTFNSFHFQGPFSVVSTRVLQSYRDVVRIPVLLFTGDFSQLSLSQALRPYNLGTIIGFRRLKKIKYIESFSITPGQQQTLKY